MTMRAGRHLKFIFASAASVYMWSLQMQGCSSTHAHSQHVHSTDQRLLNTC